METRRPRKAPVAVTLRLRRYRKRTMIIKEKKSLQKIKEIPVVDKFEFVFSKRE